jgi:hypothetical protein
MTQYKETIIWSVIHKQEHPNLLPNERRGEIYFNLIEQLFPGINYSSISGMAGVMNNYTIPVLSKLFPALVNKDAKDIQSDSVVKVEPFLPCKGLEHRDPNWRKDLETRLEAL